MKTHKFLLLIIFIACTHQLSAQFLLDGRLKYGYNYTNEQFGEAGVIGTYLYRQFFSVNLGLQHATTQRFDMRRR